MAIYICKCGFKQKLKGSFAGKKAKCPDCDKINKVILSWRSGEKSHTVYNALASCNCGFCKKLKTRKLGVAVKCPDCGKKITIVKQTQQFTEKRTVSELSGVAPGEKETIVKGNNKSIWSVLGKPYILAKLKAGIGVLFF
ncbi:MAG: hypothetical protein GY786_20785 [Proteobacteria bacterium]|nr:hypothetical protein [Pseudomonadota bacterium]